MPLRHVLKGRDTAGGSYGTVVATSVVVGLSKNPQLTPGQALLILTVTTTVFVLAKAYALSLSERATLGTLSSWGRAAERALRMGALDAGLGLAPVAVKAPVG